MAGDCPMRTPTASNSHILEQEQDIQRVDMQVIDCFCKAIGNTNCCML